VVTVQSDALQEPSPGAERLESEPNLAVVPAQATPASERELLVLEVGCCREAPAIARAALRRIQELGAARDDAILVASELATNAVVHSGGSPAETIQVRAVLIGGDVSISVRNPGLSGDIPHLRDADASHAGGRGLRIVQQLARRWGFELDRGYRVWAELATGRGDATQQQEILSGDNAGGAGRRRGRSDDRGGLTGKAARSRSAGAGAAGSHGTARVSLPSNQ
jgi:anti-sigma regulatory factor (Ser/Thr protein kinase)